MTFRSRLAGLVGLLVVLVLVGPGVARADDEPFPVIPFNTTLGYGRYFGMRDAPGALTFGIDLVDIHLRRVFLNLGELRMAVIDGDGAFTFGGRAGVPFHAGSERQHCLEVGLGASWASLGIGPRPSSTFDLSPGVRYTFHGIVGAEVQAFLPVAGDLAGGYPAAVMLNAVFNVPIGLAVPAYLLGRR